MKRLHLAVGTALALTSVWAVAQDAPESLLPPGFDRPAAKAAPKAVPKAAAKPAPAPAPAAVSSPAASPGEGPVQPGASDTVTASSESSPSSVVAVPARKMPSLDELERLSPEELVAALGVKPVGELPGSRRRSLKQAGVLSEEEGGLPPASLAKQNGGLVSAALEGNSGRLVSRWGHILLRRALASRLDAPAAMNPADFVALRAALLVRMGEGDTARALVQDVDTGNFNKTLSDAAMDAYVATADYTGLCPVISVQGTSRKEPQWVLAQSICEVFRGNGNSAMSKLDSALAKGSLPRIDVLLAQKYAGAAGKARRAVKIEWDGVKDMTPWRYGLTIAVGLQPPANLMKGTGTKYDYMTATAPMAGLSARAAAADRAADRGVLSGAAMVDLYGQLFSDGDTDKDWKAQTGLLRTAFTGTSNSARVDAIEKLWDGADSDLRYGRYVLTSAAAARMPVDPALAGKAAELIASMLASGYDQNAMRWSSLVEEGSLAWGLLMFASPGDAREVGLDALKSFESNDDSDDSRKSAFLLAGLAGLGRVSPDTVTDFSDRLDISLQRNSRWSAMIEQAARAENAALVALLAGLGMQGADWSKMTPMHLFRIVSALQQVGLEAEARMIAAEAVARG